MKFELWLVLGMEDCLLQPAWVRVGVCFSLTTHFGVLSIKAYVWRLAFVNFDFGAREEKTRYWKMAIAPCSAQVSILRPLDTVKRIKMNVEGC